MYIYLRLRDDTENLVAKMLVEMFCHIQVLNLELKKLSHKKLQCDTLFHILENGSILMIICVSKWVQLRFTEETTFVKSACAKINVTKPDKYASCLFVQSRILRKQSYQCDSDLLHFSYWYHCVVFPVFTIYYLVGNAYL